MVPALKEWAVLIEALTRGEQQVLLRKGGISESSRGFELLHRSFLFFPTWEHQQREWVRPEFHELFEAVRPADPDRIEIRYRGTAENIAEAPADRTRFNDAAGPHIWTDEFVRMRYDYRPDLPLYLVRVRVEPLETPLNFADTREFRGCRSWVELSIPAADL